MKKLTFTPYPGQLSGYGFSETHFAKCPKGIIWESFEGVWVSA